MADDSAAAAAPEAQDSGAAAAPAADAGAAPVADAAPAADAGAAPAADAGAAPAPAAADGDAVTKSAFHGDLAPAGVRDIDYVSVLGNYVRQDVRRQNGTHYGSGASFIFGRHFGNGWGWEANYTFSGLETGPSGGSDAYLHTLGGDLTYSFGDRQHLTPFLLIGGGGILEDVHPRLNGGASGYVDAGAGLTTGTFWHKRIRLRAEVRAIHDFTSTPARDGFTDYRAGLGIEIPFYEFNAVQPAALPPPEVKTVEVIEKVPVASGLQDDDGDGVVNEKDKCPNTPPNTRVDGDGCPLPKVVRLEGVTFEFNKSRLRPDSQTILNWVTDIMKKYPDMKVELSGYTDNIGKASYNLKLSQARAEAVKQYLVETGGIDAGRMDAKGYGKENPVAGNDTDEGRERNRRVELHILN